MIRKIALMAAVLSLLALTALAFADDAAPLDWRELDAWAQDCLERARSSRPLNDPADPASMGEDGYAFVYDFATLYMSRPTLDGDSLLQGILVLDVEQVGPRGLDTAMSLSEAMSLFCNDNPLLSGSRSGAVLYAREDRDGFLWGYLQRDGQRAGLVQYAVHARLEDGITDAGLLLTVQDQGISAIRVYGLQNRIGEKELDATREFVEVEAEKEDYEKVPSSMDGDEVTRFSAGDLVFAGLDLTRLTPEAATGILGVPVTDESARDEDGTTLRTLRFDTCELVFSRAGDEAEQLMFFTCEESETEGPRAVRIGDTLTEVMARFAAETVAGGTLYGSPEEGEYGTVEFGEDASAVLRYAAKLEDGRTAVLLMGFERLELTEYHIFFLNPETEI